MKAIALAALMLVIQHSGLTKNDRYDITEAGAVGDGTTLNTYAIQHTIDRCSAAGGGCVAVPPGVFLTGTIRLRDNVELHLETGAVIKGSERVSDYLLNGKRVGLLFTQDARNVSITGEGTIDGNGDSFMELDRPKRIDSTGSAWTRQGIHFRELKRGVGDGPAVPKERPYQMIIFSDCRGVTVTGVHITNSPFWTLHCADCDGVMIRGVRIWCNLLVPNNDGIDITSCSNVIIADCDIRTGDDCIAVTGYSHHFDLPGYKELRHPCENVSVSNCLMQSRSAAIRIGGFDQNPIRNLSFTNITITNSNRGIGIFARDQGSIENLMFSNIIIETRYHTGDWWGNGDPIHLSAVRLTKDVPLGKIRNVKFQHVICRGSSGILVYGTPESIIEGLSLEDVTFHLTADSLADFSGGNFDLRPVLDQKLQLFAHEIPGIYVQYVSEFRLHDIDLSWGPVAQSFYTCAVEVKHFDSVSIKGLRGSAAPGGGKRHAVSVGEGRGFRSDSDPKDLEMRNVKPVR